MAQFQVHYNDGDHVGPLDTAGYWAERYSRSPSTYEWPTFEEAEQARRDLTARFPSLANALRVAIKGDFPADMDWRLREKLRFGDATHQPTPWHDAPWYQAKHEDHFCHLSKQQPGKVAFTENEAKGAADRQLIMSPGRYLNRYFSDVLDNCAIEGWCAKLSVQLKSDELKITQDADEIEDVYTLARASGMSSCMSYSAGHFYGHCHPVRVYAGPDTALAYIGTREDARARTIVWPERKVYTRIYGGEHGKLRVLLEEAGYSSGALDGARVRRIEDQNSGGFIVPYIDSGGDLADAGDCLVIGRGSIESQNTSGVSGESWTCERCGEGTDEECSSYIEDVEERWCERCICNYATSCDHDGNYYTTRSNNFVTVYARYGPEYTVLEDNADSFGAVYVDSRDEWWMVDCTFLCADCDQRFHTDDRADHEDGICENCAAARADADEDDEEAIETSEGIRDQHDAHVVAWREHLEAAREGPFQVFRQGGFGPCPCIASERDGARRTALGDCIFDRHGEAAAYAAHLSQMHHHSGFTYVVERYQAEALLAIAA